MTTKTPAQTYDWITPDTVLDDYCRDEDDAVEVARSMRYWLKVLEAVGAAIGNIQNPGDLSYCEVGWSMTLRQAELAVNKYGWFDRGEGVPVYLASIIDEDDDAADVDWDQHRYDAKVPRAVLTRIEEVLEQCRKERKGRKYRNRRAA